MGWCSGSRLFADVITALQPRVGHQIRREIYKELICSFENFDCDTLDEGYLEGDKAFDEIWEEMGRVEIFDEEREEK